MSTVWYKIGMETLLRFDTVLTQFFYFLFPHSLFWSGFFSFFSQRGLSIIIWIIIILAIFVVEEKRDKRFLFYFLAGFVVTGIMVNVLLKGFFQRPRPIAAKTSRSVVYSCPNDYSFPSGHAATAFASAVILAYFDRKRALLYFFVAILISYSRIFLRCHYFLDVAAGAIIGSLISMLILHIRPAHSRKDSGTLI
ncbi:phosphatase PAP2 family protein [Candidatus Roizmanbacteria bacterium]|nr:phosphatase PAP2 family protein [Candidatus Roizmanbacteria bacterium]